VEEQPFTSVPVTVYVVVEEGFAVTDEPVVLLRLFDGDHVYKEAPPALRVTD